MGLSVTDRALGPRGDGQSLTPLAKRSEQNSSLRQTLALTQNQHTFRSAAVVGTNMRSQTLALLEWHPAESGNFEAHLPRNLTWI